MSRGGETTKQKIMDVAQELILDHGYGGMSIDQILEGAGITKGAFFYHFKSKSELAHALVLRYAEEDTHHFKDAMERAENLSRDPLQQLLIFVGLFVEMMAELETAYPGCLYAAYCYQSGLMEDQDMQTVADQMRFWRKNVLNKINEVLERYSPRVPVDAASLADQLLVTFEGAFILSKTLNEPKLTSRQLEHYRNYLEILFTNDVS